MRLLALLAPLLGCIVATCTQEPCNMKEDEGWLSSSPDQLFEKRFIPDQIRRASIRWGKRQNPISKIRESARFWGKRDVADSIRRASIRWGKRSFGDASDLLPMGDLVYPSHLFQPRINAQWTNAADSAEATSQEESGDSMQRVTKADALRPKLALSSRLWGR